MTDDQPLMCIICGRHYGVELGKDCPHCGSAVLETTITANTTLGELFNRLHSSRKSTLDVTLRDLGLEDCFGLSFSCCSGGLIGVRTDGEDATVEYLRDVNRRLARLPEWTLPD